MKAVVLAGGRGTRLAPYTTVFPKPMLPIGEKPILEIIIRQLAYYGFNDIVLSVGHLAEIIQTYFQNKNVLPDAVRLTYVREDKPLGTAGPLSLIPGLDETFLVMNGDILTTLNYQELFEFHREKESMLTNAVSRKEVEMDLGIIELGDDSQIINYTEKPTYTFLNNTGIYVYEPEVLRYIEPHQHLDFDVLVRRLIDNGKNVYGYCHNELCYWIDIGNHGDYEKSNEEFQARRSEFLPHSQ